MFKKFKEVCIDTIIMPMKMMHIYRSCSPKSMSTSTSRPIPRLRPRTIIRCNAKHDHTIFQLNPTSPIVTLDDVRQAMEATKHMTPYHRLRYFQDKGIHYSRSLRYIKMVEEFERMMNETSTSTSTSTSMSVNTEPIPIKWEDEPTIEISSNDLAMWISHHAESVKEPSKIKVQPFVKHIISIFFITIALLMVQFLVS